jgi:hypothetical protein
MRRHPVFPITAAGVIFADVRISAFNLMVDMLNESERSEPFLWGTERYMPVAWMLI